MGYAEKFLLCKNERDTDKLVELLKRFDNGGYDIAARSVLKQNFMLKYRNIIGTEIAGKKIPFQHVSILEVENEDKIYRKPLDIPDFEEGVKPAPWFTEENSILLDRNRSLIWVRGDRGATKDGYSLLGLDFIALAVLLKSYDESHLPEEILVDGKIDVEKSVPVAAAYIAQQELTEEEVRILEEVTIIDLDGIPDVDAKLHNNNLFRHKKI